MLPKITKGSIHLQWKTCGKNSCRCNVGALHGPYVALHRRIGGRQTKKYIRLADLPVVLAMLEVIAGPTQVLHEVQHDLKEGGRAYY